MPHLVLLGDSIFDNRAYTRGGPDVIAQVRKMLPSAWTASLLAVDGATTADVPRQLDRLPRDATHAVISIGGNDALLEASILDLPAASAAEAITHLADAGARFEAGYRDAIAACLAVKLPLALCTIYNGCFPDARYQRIVSTALSVFNDVILRVAIEHRLAVIDLRAVCADPADYANPIEPSSVGGEKIARVIVGLVTGSRSGEAARIVA